MKNISDTGRTGEGLRRSKCDDGTISLSVPSVTENIIFKRRRFYKYKRICSLACLDLFVFFTKHNLCINEWVIKLSPSGTDEGESCSLKIALQLLFEWHGLQWPVRDKKKQRERAETIKDRDRNVSCWNTKHHSHATTTAGNLMHQGQRPGGPDPRKQRRMQASHTTRPGLLPGSSSCSPWPVGILDRL